MFRHLFSPVAVAAALLSGCGESAPPPVPSAFVGVYDVTVTARGREDTTIMQVVQGSGATVLLTFADGFTPIRCTVTASTGLTVPRQLLQVGFSTGPREATTTGAGTLSGELIDITLNVVAADVSGTSPPPPTDAAVADAGGPPPDLAQAQPGADMATSGGNATGGEYKIVGMRQPPM